MPAPTTASLIDAVNERDEAIGTVTRGDALRIGASFRTAHIFLLNDAGDILLQRLAPGRERHPGRWGSSVAAYLNSGETYGQAAKRRLFEELGLALPLRRMGKLRMRDDHSLKFVSLYLAIDGVPAVREPDHIAAAVYWSRAQVQEALLAEPSQFTPTFRELYRTFADRLP
jgi:isopentenyl-diphosphate Delta-isomerase